MTSHVTSEECPDSMNFTFFTSEWFQTASQVCSVSTIHGGLRITKQFSVDAHKSKNSVIKVPTLASPDMLS